MRENMASASAVNGRGRQRQDGRGFYFLAMGRQCMEPGRSSLHCIALHNIMYVPTNNTRCSQLAIINAFVCVRISEPAY